MHRPAVYDRAREALATNHRAVVVWERPVPRRLPTRIIHAHHQYVGICIACNDLQFPLPRGSVALWRTLYSLAATA
jgi:hypothetical protein